MCVQSNVTLSTDRGNKFFFFSTSLALVASNLAHFTFPAVSFSSPVDGAVFHLTILVYGVRIVMSLRFLLIVLSIYTNIMLL